MASWTDAAHALPVPHAQRRRKTAPKRRPRARRGVAGGAAWIVLVAVLLAGVVALNVAVLRLNMTLDRLGRERVQLRADTAALQSQLSSAAATGRIEALAVRRLGYVPATPDQTTYVQLGR